MGGPVRATLGVPPSAGISYGGGHLGGRCCGDRIMDDRAARAGKRTGTTRPGAERHPGHAIDGDHRSRARAHREADGSPTRHERRDRSITLIRTLVYEGYLLRDDLATTPWARRCPTGSGTSPGRCVARTRAVHALRRAVAETGYSHFLARFVGGRVSVTAVAEGPHSPWLEDWCPASTTGRTPPRWARRCWRRSSPIAVSAISGSRGCAIHRRHHHRSDRVRDGLGRGRKRGMQIEIGQYRAGVACAAVPVVADGDVTQRTVVGCALPIRDFMHSAKDLRARLHATAKALAPLLSPPSKSEAAA